MDHSTHANVAILTLHPSSFTRIVAQASRVAPVVSAKTTITLRYNSDYNLAGFTNDLDGGMPFYPIYIKDGKMYQMLDAIDFIEYAEVSNSAKMKEVAATLTEESNPVLVVVTLK